MLAQPNASLIIRNAGLVVVSAFIVSGCADQAANAPREIYFLSLPANASTEAPDEKLLRLTLERNAKQFWLRRNDPGGHSIAVPKDRVLILSTPDGRLAAISLVSVDNFGNSSLQNNHAVEGAEFEWMLQSQKPDASGKVSIISGKQRVYENYNSRPMTADERQIISRSSDSKNIPKFVVEDKGSQTYLLIGDVSVEWSFPVYLYPPDDVCIHITDIYDLDAIAPVLQAATPDNLRERLDGLHKVE
jgi:hypothetical protein